jgi:hypothetical protein
MTSPYIFNVTSYTHSNLLHDDSIRKTFMYNLDIHITYYKKLKNIQNFYA